MRKIPIVLSLMLLACGQEPLRPERAEFPVQTSAEFGGGLVQVVEFGPAPEMGERVYLLRSQVRNQSDAPIRAVTRECIFRDEDIATDLRYEIVMMPGCMALSSTRVLGAGESSSWVSLVLRPRSRAGTYTMHLRHALDPEHTERLSLVIE